MPKPKTKKRGIYYSKSKKKWVHKIPIEKIGEDVIQFIKKQKQPFIVVRRIKKEIIYEKENRPYTRNELGQGFKYAKEKGVIRKISNVRWEIIGDDDATT
jgi:hypothetical protein